MEQISSKRRLLLSSNNRLTPMEMNTIEGDLASLLVQKKSYDRQIEIRRQKEQDLEIRCPITGTVVTWKVQELLMRRTVKAGQKLMTVVDPTGPWELELGVPEKRMGHVARAWKDAQEHGEDLNVIFHLASDPATEFAGQVKEIHAAADIYEEDGNAVKVVVKIDKRDISEVLLRPATQLKAKIHCGERPIGYVWLHDLIAWIQTNVLFWF